MNLRGRVVVGTFSGVRSVTFGRAHPKAGEEVPGGLREVVIVVDEAEEEFVRLSFFLDGYGGPTPMARALESSGVQPGDLVAVRFTTRAKVSPKGDKAYVNDDAVTLEVLQSARPRLAAVAGGSD